MSFDTNPEVVARGSAEPVEELALVKPQSVMRTAGRWRIAGGGDAATLEGEDRVVRRARAADIREELGRTVRPMLE